MARNLVPEKRNPFATRNKASSSNSTFTVGAEASNAITVTLQLKDEKNANLSERKGLDVWVSDSATTGALNATAVDGGVAIGASGAIVLAVTASKYFKCLTSATGALALTLTHAAGAKTVYLYVRLPDGKIITSGAITFAA